MLAMAIVLGFLATCGVLWLGYLFFKQRNKRQQTQKSCNFQSKPLKDWVDVLNAERKMDQIIDTIERHSSWTEYRRLMDTSYSEKVQTRYQSLAAAMQALDNLNATLGQISEYVRFILPGKLVQIRRVDRTPLIKDLDRLQTGIEVEMAEREMIAEGLDEELLIYGLPFFLLRNNTIRSIWFCADSARTQCAFMSPEIDFPREQQNQLIDFWKRARAERDPRPRNEQRNLQIQGRLESLIPETNLTASKNDNYNEGNCASNPTTMLANLSATKTPGIGNLSCPICCEDYNVNDLKPMNLAPCGHSVCSMCQRRIRQCPTCRSKITSSSVAFTVLGILETLSKVNDELTTLRALKEIEERELKELKEKKLKAELEATVDEMKEGERPTGRARQLLLRRLMIEEGVIESEIEEQNDQFF